MLQWWRLTASWAHKYFKNSIRKGKVIVGLLTDEAIASYKRVPMKME